MATTFITVDEDIVAHIKCDWITPTSVPGLAGASLPGVKKKQIAYSVFIVASEETIVNLSFNAAIVRVVDYLSSFPTKSMIGSTCGLYPSMDLPAERRDVLVYQVLRAMILIRDMLTDKKMMRAEQGDVEHDALVEYDRDYIDDLMHKWDDIYSVTSHLSGGVF
jgi:hypothetical protein